MKISEINAMFFDHRLAITEEHNYGTSVAI